MITRDKADINNSLFCTETGRDSCNFVWIGSIYLKTSVECHELSFTENEPLAKLFRNVMTQSVYSFFQVDSDVFTVHSISEYFECGDHSVFSGRAAWCFLGVLSKVSKN